MGVGIMDRVVQKMIALLKAESTVTKYTGSGADARIYGAHISTIQDPVFPAVSIHLLASPGRDVSGGWLDTLEFQIEPWLYAVGKNSSPVDDAVECYEGIVTALHRSGAWDNTIGIKIHEITEIGRAPIVVDPDGLRHIPGRFRVRATL
jgi:hypothetical protein